MCMHMYNIYIYIYVNSYIHVHIIDLCICIDLSACIDIHVCIYTCIYQFPVALVGGVPQLQHDSYRAYLELKSMYGNDLVDSFRWFWVICVRTFGVQVGIGGSLN